MMKLAIVGDVATQLLAEALRAECAARDLACELFEAPFDQVRQQLLTADSALWRFAPSFVIVWEAVERWRERALSVVERLKAVEALCGGGATILYVNAADGAGVDSAAVRAFNAGLDALAARRNDFRVIDLASLVATRGRETLFSPMAYYTWSMALTAEAQTTLAQRIVAFLAAAAGRERKVAVVDLDGTLWGGIVGETGVHGLEIGETPLGRAHADFQRWLLALKRRGVLLAVSSKNDADLVRRVFAERPEMVLREDDFVACRVNWEPKSANLVQLANELNLGLEAFVFLDDRKVEREAMRAALPAVTVPELPDDPAEWLPFLDGLDLFTAAAASEDDEKRTARYQAEAARRAVRQAFADERAFLRDLDQRATEVPLTAETIPRVAQLTQRTNQFNVLTRRYDEAQLAALAADTAVVPLLLRLTDRFGDSGLVSVMLGRRTDTELVLDTWLMSCRVIGRGLEVFALNAFVARARQAGVKTIIGRYEPTAKNALVRDLFPSLGFTARGDGSYALAVETYRNQPCEIHEADL